MLGDSPMGSNQGIEKICHVVLNSYSGFGAFLKFQTIQRGNQLLL